MADFSFPTSQLHVTESLQLEKWIEEKLITPNVEVLTKYLVLATALLFLTLLVEFYINGMESFWSDRGVPVVRLIKSKSKVTPIFGENEKNIVELDRHTREDYCGMMMGRRPILVITNPRQVNEILEDFPHFGRFNRKKLRRMQDELKEDVTDEAFIHHLNKTGIDLVNLIKNGGSRMSGGNDDAITFDTLAKAIDNVLNGDAINNANFSSLSINDTLENEEGWVLFHKQFMRQQKRGKFSFLSARQSLLRYPKLFMKFLLTQWQSFGTKERKEDKNKKQIQEPATPSSGLPTFLKNSIAKDTINHRVNNEDEGRQDSELFQNTREKQMKIDEASLDSLHTLVSVKNEQQFSWVIHSSSFEIEAQAQTPEEHDDRESCGNNFLQEENKNKAKMNFGDKLIFPLEIHKHCFRDGVMGASELIAWALRNIALNPGCQHKLYQEVEQCLHNKKGNRGEEIDLEAVFVDKQALQSMNQIDMVINETLRHFPPAYHVMLECTKETDFDYDLLLPLFQGNPKLGWGKEEETILVLIPVIAFHRNSKYFPDPDKKFHPVAERFSPEKRGKIRPAFHIPFGYGPRDGAGSDGGTRFGVVQSKCALAHLIHNFIIEAEPPVPNVSFSVPLPMEHELKNDYDNFQFNGGFRESVRMMKILFRPRK